MQKIFKNKINIILLLHRVFSCKFFHIIYYESFPLRRAALERKRRKHENVMMLLKSVELKKNFFHGEKLVNILWLYQGYGRQIKNNNAKWRKEIIFILINFSGDTGRLINSDLSWHSEDCEFRTCCWQLSVQLWECFTSTFVSGETDFEGGDCLPAGWGTLKLDAYMTMNEWGENRNWTSHKIKTYPSPKID